MTKNLTVPITPLYLCAFLLLTFLCYEAHELFHHLAGGLLCGGVGTMTFTTYVPKPDCKLDAIVTLSGPLFSFVLAWLGAYWLVKRKHLLFAYTLIFASYAHLRFPLPLMGSGDEWQVARTNFEQPNAMLVAGILFLLALPPLVIAYRSIANPWRAPVFAVSWILPFVLLGSITYLDSLLSETSAAWIGVPIIVWVVNALAVLCLVVIGAKLFRNDQ